MAHEDLIDAAVAKHEAALREIWQLIRKARRDPDLTEHERTAVLERLYAPLSTKDAREFFVEDSGRYSIGVSFRSSVMNMMRFKGSLRRLGLRIAPGRNPKMSDREFGRQLGVDVPQTFQDNVPLREIELTPRSILKPASGAGARGVAHIDDEGRLVSVNTGRMYLSVADGAEEFPPLTPGGEETKWIREQAIYGPDGRPANDLKVFMFYGEPGAILEVARNRGESRAERLFCTYDAEGREIEFYQGVKTFSGTGLPPDLLEKARRISLATPIPFLRIDFHRGADSSVLGEITPHPGHTYAGDLDDGIDRAMGQMFHDAEARLFRDILAGKRFAEYARCYTPGPPLELPDPSARVYRMDNDGKIP